MYIKCLVISSNQLIQASQHRSLEILSTCLKAVSWWLSGQHFSSDWSQELVTFYLKSDEQTGSCTMRRQVLSSKHAHMILSLIISTGKACFLCKNDHATCNFAVANECTNCSPAVALPKQAPCILEHMAAHILFNSGIK